MTALRRGLPWLMFALGMTMAHRPMLATGLARIQADAGDPRLLNYVLEHGYLWASGDPHHRDFWSPPFFFPARNAAGYSDVLLGTAPVYWGWRTLGNEPDTAFGLWLLTLSGLNFLGGYLMLRKGFRFGTAASAIGAFLLAFGAPRINQLGHAQLLAQFPTFATVGALARLFDGSGGSSRRHASLWGVAALGVVVQFYAGFYLGWFLVLAIGVAAGLGLALPTPRRLLLPVLVRDAPAIGAAGALAGLLLWPMAGPYLMAAKEIGPRSYETTLRMVPRPSSLLYLGPRSHLYGWMADLRAYRGRPLELEHRMGIGPLTTLVCLAGLVLRPSGRFLALVGLALVGITTLFPGRTIVAGAPWMVAVCAGLLAKGRDRPGMRGLALGAMVLTVDPSGGLLLGAALLCGIDAWRKRAGPTRAAVAGGIGLGLLVTVGMSPTLLTLALGLAPTVVLAAKRSRPNRVPAGAWATIAVLAALASWGFRDTDTLWKHVYDHVPAGAAVRAVARVGLLLLIPAAIGMAAAIEALAGRRRFAIAALLASACVLEQWVETPSYARGPKRADVAAIVARVDPRSSAFYFSPRHSPIDAHENHLDAMWASLATGIPTINGYSGGSPRDWEPLKEINLRDDRDRDRLGAALLRWAEAHGLRPGQICWIGGPPEGPFAPGLGDEPAHRPATSTH